MNDWSEWDSLEIILDITLLLSCPAHRPWQITEVYTEFKAKTLWIY